LERVVTAAFTAVVVGNPTPASRTLHAASYVATELAGHAPDPAQDLGGPPGQSP
jgi:FMN reductase